MFYCFFGVTFSSSSINVCSIINDWHWQFVSVCQFLLGIYRLLAHAKVESVKSKVAAEERKIKKSWFSFRWYGATSLTLHILITLGFVYVFTCGGLNFSNIFWPC